MYTRTIQLIFFFSIFGVALILAFFIFQPYLNILVLAGMFAIISNPFYKKVLRKFGGAQKGLAAFLTVVVMVVIIGVPLGFLGLQVFNEASSLYGRIGDAAAHEQGILGNIEPSANPIIRNIQEKFQAFM